MQTVEVPEVWIREVPLNAGFTVPICFRVMGSRGSRFYCSRGSRDCIVLDIPGFQRFPGFNEVAEFQRLQGSKGSRVPLVPEIPEGAEFQRF